VDNGGPTPGGLLLCCAMYTHLDPAKIVATVTRLRDRIYERFPNSSLGRVAEALLRAAENAGPRSDWLARPIRWLRGTNAGLILLGLAVLAGIVLNLKLSTQVDRFSELLQALDSGLNSLILLGGGIFFLFTVEVRLKRRAALKAIQELRSLAHIVDMHQLTKDPERLLARLPQTESSPERTMTSAELIRYLGYCGELLSLIGKAAALYVRAYDDPVVLSAVDQIEDLTTGLSRKMWQKINILDRAQD
jgi:hypothetical protein